MNDLCCVLHTDLFSLFANRSLAVEISQEFTNKFPAGFSLSYRFQSCCSCLLQINSLALQSLK